MKIIFLLGTFWLAVSFSRASSFLGLAVAEQTGPATAEMSPSATQRALYIAYDGGYMEVGLPVAGTVPPSAHSIEIALRDSLRGAGYETASGSMRPSTALVLNWGYIHHDYPFAFGAIDESAGDRSFNYQARLLLVSTTRAFERTIEFIQNRYSSNWEFYPTDIRDTLQMASGGRYFVVISAYDFSELTQGVATLLWRVKLSAQDTDGDIREVLPALIRGASPYIGKSLRKPISFSARLQEDNAATQPAEPFPLADATKEVRPDFVYQLVRDEHRLFSGEMDLANMHLKGTAGPSPRELDSKNKIASSSRVGIPIPRALADRMLAYRRERAALDLALNSKIKSQSSAERRRAAIDQFNRENAMQVAALNRESESIRSELAAAEAASSYHPPDQSVAHLIRQFNELDLDSLSSDLPVNQH